MSSEQEKKARVLIIDDNASNIQIVGTLLKNEGYQIYVANNGLQAINIVEEILPDLILLDIMMPGMDGIETSKRIKKNSQTREVPIIFITAKSDVQDVVRGFESGGSDYITKPFQAPVLLARVRTHVALWQKTKQLRAYSDRDYLTMIANRRRFDEFIDLEWRRCLREQRPLSLIILDIDYFKNYNDTYGHLQGDEVLKKVAYSIKNICNRSGDLAARYGGEEFAIVLGNTNLQTSQLLAEKYRHAIESLTIVHEASKVKNVVTASLGVATTTPDMNDSYQQLIKAADERLYLAKKSGRNQVK